MPYIGNQDAVVNPLLDNIIATPGGPQVGATLLGYGRNRVVTVGSVNDSVMMPPAIGSGQVVWISNTAANQLTVFPQVGDRFNAGAINAGFTVAGGAVGSRTLFVDMAPGVWA